MSGDDSIFDLTKEVELVEETETTEDSLLDQASYALGTVQELVAAIPTEAEVNIPFVFQGTVNPRALFLGAAAIVVTRLLRR